MNNIEPYTGTYFAAVTRLNGSYDIKYGRSMDELGEILDGIEEVTNGALEVLEVIPDIDNGSLIALRSTTQGIEDMEKNFGRILE